jgi:regulator of protease activity HflC (stomatin/prohibitin superfamily)
MNTWIVFLIVLVPFLALLGWMASSDSLINIPPGKVGLLMVNGRATDQVLQPGLHWVPRLRRRVVAEYPSLELSFRALRDGEPMSDPVENDRVGPPVRVTLGDRTQAVVGYTVRFRLDENRLKSVHERFGPDGFWTAVRDTSGQAIRLRIGESGVGVDDLFGSRWQELEQEIGESVTAVLGGEGLVVTMLSVGDVDLGRTGAVIQATVRARLELEREEAEAALRTARARIDSELEPLLSSVPDAALRYREVDVWRDLVHTQADRAARMPGRPIVTVSNAEAAEPTASETAGVEAADET